VKRIVIADDSSTARMFIRRCLEIVGLRDQTFVEATNGREALDLLKEAPTDLLVTDLNMPQMDGETLLKWIRANPKLSSTPVVVITSAGNPAKEARLLELGALRVINKPVTPTVLMETLSFMLK